MAERPQIPQHLLDFVGLTEEKFAQFDQEAQEEARQRREFLLRELDQGKQKGISFYKDR